jgi:hypothetical protein
MIERALDRVAPVILHGKPSAPLWILSDTSTATRTVTPPRAAGVPARLPRRAPRCQAGLIYLPSALAAGVACSVRESSAVRTSARYPAQPPGPFRTSLVATSARLDSRPDARPDPPRHADIWPWDAGLALLPRRLANARPPRPADPLSMPADLGATLLGTVRPRALSQTVLPGRPSATRRRFRRRGLGLRK